MPKTVTMITATRVDPGTLESVLGDRKRNLAALSNRQLYDSKRIRVRMDVNEATRDLFRIEAKESGTSVSDFVAFLATYALGLWMAGNEAMGELWSVRECKSPSKDYEVDLGLVQSELKKAVAESVAQPAEPLPSAKESDTVGRLGGATDRGDWLGPVGRV